MANNRRGTRNGFATRLFTARQAAQQQQQPVSQDNTEGTTEMQEKRQINVGYVVEMTDKVIENAVKAAEKGLIVTTENELGKRIDWNRVEKAREMATALGVDGPLNAELHRYTQRWGEEAPGFDLVAYGQQDYIQLGRALAQIQPLGKGKALVSLWMGEDKKPVVVDGNVILLSNYSLDAWAITPGGFVKRGTQQVSYTNGKPELAVRVFGAHMINNRVRNLGGHLNKYSLAAALLQGKRVCAQAIVGKNATPEQVEAANKAVRETVLFYVKRELDIYSGRAEYVGE